MTGATMPFRPQPGGTVRSPCRHRITAIGITGPRHHAAPPPPCRSGRRPMRRRRSASSTPGRGHWTTVRAISCGTLPAMPFRATTSAKPCACWNGPQPTSPTTWPASPISCTRSRRCWSPPASSGCLTTPSTGSGASGKSRRRRSIPFTATWRSTASAWSASWPACATAGRTRSPCRARAAWPWRGYSRASASGTVRICSTTGSGTTTHCSAGT